LCSLALENLINIDGIRMDNLTLEQLNELKEEFPICKDLIWRKRNLVSILYYDFNKITKEEYYLYCVEEIKKAGGDIIHM